MLNSLTSTYIATGVPNRAIAQGPMYVLCA